MTSRNQALYGKVGQELLYESKILINGLKNAGIETIKTAAMLGIGKIYIIDDERSQDIFIDQPIISEKSKAKQIEAIVNELKFRCGNTREFVHVEAFENSYFNNTELIQKINPDAIFDFTNDLSAQYQSIKYGIILSKNKQIDLFLGGCDNQDLQLVHYSANKHDDPKDIADEKEIDRYNDKKQGIITSHILSSMAIEFFKQVLFKRNKELFLKTPREDRKEPYKERGNFETSIAYSIKYPDLVHKIKFNKNNVNNIILDKDEFTIEELDCFGNSVNEFHLDDLNDQNTSLEGKTALVCGCGAIGNPLADMLVKKGAKKIDFIDYDRIESHNVERQPFYCKKDGEFKAEVLSEKIKSIASQMGRKIDSAALVGKVCEKIDNKFEQNAFNKEWFDKNRYDVVFGCFDSAIARETLNEYAAKLNFMYVDSGSLPNAGNAVTFIPGKTACLDCTVNVKMEADMERSNPALAAEQTCGNIENIPGTVNMSNRIAAALAVSEAGKYLNSSNKEPVSGKVMYFNKENGFEIVITKPNCDLCKNDGQEQP